MTTDTKNRRTKQEQRSNWFGLCLARRRKTKVNRRTFLYPRKRGKRRGLRAETKLVWALPCKEEDDEVNVLVVLPL